MTWREKDKEDKILDLLSEETTTEGCESAGRERWGEGSAPGGQLFSSDSTTHEQSNPITQENPIPFTGHWFKNGPRPNLGH